MLLGYGAKVGLGNMRVKAENRMVTETAADIDQEVLFLIKEAHQKAKDIITRNLTIMHQAAKFLMERETITGEEFMKIVRENLLNLNLLVLYCFTIF